MGTEVATMGIQLKKLVQIFGNDISMEMPSNKHLGNKNEQHLALAIKHDNSTNNYVDKRLIALCLLLWCIFLHIMHNRRMMMI